jgi:AraC-like DNA-binding protein
MFAHMPIVKDILIGAQKYGANLHAMCKALDINPYDLHNSEIAVPFEKATRAWDVALEHTGNSLLGLHLGEQTSPSILGLVGHLIQNCHNLEDAFRSVCTNNALFTDIFIYTMESSGSTVILRYQPIDAWVKTYNLSSRQAVEQALAGTINVFQLLTGKRNVPLMVTIAYPHPKDSSEYERVFQTSIKFDADANTLVFSKEQMVTPIISYDESLLSLFNQLIEKKLAQLQSKNGIDDLVRNEILTTFKGQLPSLEVMASRLNMTPRSLQRRLEEHQLTYRHLTNSLGKEISATLLRNKNAKVAEVAYALGYTDPRAFQRAFKSWTGMSPGEFRKEN